MSDKRAQGRPLRGADEVGRLKIVNGTRDLIRAQSSSEISRKDIAQFVGVTPALVSYYFPSQFDLIEAVTKPVVKIYSEKVKAIVQSDKTSLAKLQNLVSLFVECHMVDGKIIESFSRLVRPSPGYSDQDYLLLMSNDVVNFLRDFLRENTRGFYDAEFVANALWGACKFVTFDKTALVPPSEGMLATSADLDGLSSRQSVLVYSLITGGMGLPE